MKVIPASELENHIGEEIGISEWIEVSQERINQFADATNDHQFIHVDPELAKSAPTPWDLHVGIHSGSLVAGTVGTKTVQFDILGKTVNVAFNICDMSDANQILISSDAWMTARNEIKVKSVGVKRLKSGQDIEMLECV